jgi:hypothetical protein
VTRRAEGTEEAAEEKRKFQREAQGGTAKSRDLLLIEGGTDTDRAVEEGVQHDPTTYYLGYRPPTPEAIMPRL